ncbi:MAG TPA: DUF4139 domain-containing protein [Burkholderiales bacterium]|nr:DUF4139 domain-containing protein [Burkholderiales bacterium]
MNSRMQLAVGAALAVLAGAAGAQDASRITAVTLYPGSATVERSARVAPGATLLQITGLPANFDPQSVRVEADAGVAIGEVSTQDVARVQSPDSREARLEERIQALRDRQAELDAETKSAQMVTEFLSRLGAPGEKPAPLPDARSLTAIVDLIGRGGGESLARARRAQVQKREIGRQVAALERDLARLKSGSRDTRTILVGVSSERGGSARVSYQVNGAGWRPAYRASLDSQDSKVELLRQGVVQQSTGEDWTGVKLRLSTGQPRLSPAGPDPRTWWVSLPVPRPYANAAGALAEAPASFAKREARARADMLAQAPAPLEQQTTFSTEFEVPGVVSLPSDGRKVTVSLARLTLPARMRLRVVPRLDPAAIVTAEAKRPEGVWLPGEIQLARDGSVVGSTVWNPQASENLLLPFGRDSLVRVKLSRVLDRNGSAGLIDRKNEREVTDVLTLSSAHKTPLDLLVLESSPVSTSDQIKVQASFDPKPQVENWDERQGVVAWERPIAPNETLKITLSYTVSYPRQGAVVGLP